MKKIPLHQLAAYLPYETKVTFIYKRKKCIGMLNGIDKYGSIITTYDNIFFSPDKFKLMLTTFDAALENKSLKRDDFNTLFVLGMRFRDMGLSVFDYEEYQFCLKHHIDIFNLIPQGLAVEKLSTSVKGME